MIWKKGKATSALLIAFCCIFVLSNVAMANTVDDNKKINANKIQSVVLEKIEKGNKPTKEEAKLLLEGVREKNPDAIEWFNGLAINQPQKIQEQFKDGIEVKKGKPVTIDFKDGSAIELSVKTESITTQSDNNVLASDEYQITVTDYARYKQKVLGIDWAYYNIHCKYGYDTSGGSAHIISHWDDGSAAWPIQVEDDGTQIEADDTNPVKVRGNGKFTAPGFSMNISGLFHCYSTNFGDDNYCEWNTY
ncbi:MAG: hypothetical protein K9L17_07170 [Clostridiales bacterium]|nr:hypothetical protein [Clostridiales bacterium]MCF8022453.1 hypothetical protein [Clostridiales bacterium]